ncbi:MAG: hypothetical protein PVF75_10645 [Granulosicoccaceae bacterium]
MNRPDTRYFPGIMVGIILAVQSVNNDQGEVMNRILRWLFAGGLVCLALAAIAHADETDFYNDDWESRAEDVSEGELVWYREAVGRKTPRLAVEINLTADSLASGWAQVSQCHEQLDPVAAADLVFTEQQVRALRVDSYANIEQVTVRDNVVELLAIGPNAKLCVRSEQKIVHGLPENLLAVIAGPYKRRFLDGYYPQGITVTVHWPPDVFRFERLHPADLSGYARLDAAPDRVQFTAHVAGRLKFAFVFSPVRP